MVTCLWEENFMKALGRKKSMFLWRKKKEIIVRDKIKKKKMSLRGK